MDINKNSIFFIAEVSGNHLGSLERARLLVDSASRCGANAVKFQTYTPDTMTLDLPEISVSEDHSLWGGRRLYDLYREAMTPWEWHAELFSYSRSLGIIPFSSPFDSSAVDFLESLDCPMYKIASLESGDIPLIRKIGETGKPTIMSTGATLYEDIVEAVSTFKSTGNLDLTLLVCTSSYPAEPKDAHLKRLDRLRNDFDVKVGVSDHTLGIGVSLAGIALGATTIEKHLTLKREDGGPDSAFSMEPEEFKNLVIEGNALLSSMGSSEWNISESESESRRLRRSLYIVKDVRAGDVVTPQNLKSIRPGYGCAPRHYYQLIGKKFVSDFKLGTPMLQEYAE